MQTLLICCGKSRISFLIDGTDEKPLLRLEIEELLCLRGREYLPFNHLHFFAVFFCIVDMRRMDIIELSTENDRSELKPVERGLIYIRHHLQKKVIIINNSSHVLRIPEK